MPAMPLDASSVISLHLMSAYVRRTGLSLAVIAFRTCQLTLSARHTLRRLRRTKHETVTL